VGQRDVVDLDNVYLPFLSQAKQVAVLVRPDFYLFGGAYDRADLATLVAGVRARLRAYRQDPIAA
jgi:flavoprotein hydroxylase